MAYTKVNWRNGEVALSDTNLNHMDQGIYDAHADIDELQSDLATARTDIGTLQTDISSAETDIRTLQSDLETTMTRIGNFRLVSYTHTVTQLKNNWHSEEFTAADVLRIFGTNDVTKIHIVALDEWVNTHLTDGSGGSWTTAAGYFNNTWFTFPRYDLHPTSKRMEVATYDPYMTASSRQLQWRLLAIVEG